MLIEWLFRKDLQILGWWLLLSAPLCLKQRSCLVERKEQHHSHLSLTCQSPTLLKPVQQTVLAWKLHQHVLIRKPAPKTCCYVGTRERSVDAKLDLARSKLSTEYKTIFSADQTKRWLQVPASCPQPRGLTLLSVGGVLSLGLLIPAGWEIHLCRLLSSYGARVQAEVVHVFHDLPKHSLGSRDKILL